MITKIINTTDKEFNEKLIASGLVFVSDFISPEEETHVLASITPTPDLGLSSRNSTKRYGAVQPYKGGIISDLIPDYLQTLNHKLLEAGYIKELHKSISINEYLPGNRVAPHIDNDES
jgi:hypothetical protein